MSANVQGRRSTFVLIVAAVVSSLSACARLTPVSPTEAASVMGMSKTEVRRRLGNPWETGEIDYCMPEKWWALSPKERRHALERVAASKFGYRNVSIYFNVSGRAFEVRPR